MAGEPITLELMQKLAAQLNNTYINVDGAAGNQCWDSAARISQLLGLPVINTWGTRERPGRWPGWAGNMWDAFPQTAEIAAAYHQVGPDQPALPGDKAIWGDSDPYYPATHVADVIKDAGALLLCISQNSSAARPDLPGYSTDSSGPTIIQYLPKRGLLGYLRPTAAGINYQSTTPQEDALSAAEITQILEGVQVIVRNQAARDDELNAAHHVATREHVNGKIPDIAAAAADATLGRPVRYRDPLTGAETDQTTTLGTVVAFNDFNEVQTRIEATSSPREIANLVPEAFVEEVSRLLIERLAK